jgi:glycosyltransferase involved in cell wall biosynthesis
LANVNSVRIVYLNPCGKLGGAETSLREILASLRVAQPDWDLWLVLGEDGPLARIGRDLGVQVVIRPFPAELSRLGDAGGSIAWWPMLKAAAATAGYTRNLTALLNEIKPDLIHTNGFKMHLLGAAARPRRTPLVWHIHDYVSSRRLVSRLLRLCRRSCTVAIANSKSVAGDLGALFPGLAVKPIYNAIDLQRFSPAGNKLDLDACAGLAPAAPGTIRVGLLATFARWKGHTVFLEALAALPSDVPVRGYIIGGPIYQTQGSQWRLSELQQKADFVCGRGRVGFTGFIEDSAAAMRSLDIVVHASTEPEPFGMVIIEGMACGKAVIASQVGGAGELFTDGEDALAHRAGDAAQLGQQIQRLAFDAGLRAKLGTGGRRTAERLYDAKRLATELAEVYRQIVPDSEEKSRTTTAVFAANGH